MLFVILIKRQKLDDFFRIYSHHLLLYSTTKGNEKNNSRELTLLPNFRKNIYTKEIIEFILERIENKEMTKAEVIKEYRVPKTTLYRWLYKYKSKSYDNK